MQKMRSVFLFLFVLQLSGGTALLCGNEPEKKPADRQVSQAEFAKWLKRAQKQDTEAQVRVGRFYEMGHGVAKDERIAAEWYRKAATRGSGTGQISLGAMYENGKGVSQDYSEAMKWYRRAAQNEKSQSFGQPYGQFLLGRMYAEGRGTQQDYAEAIEWYRLAASGNARLAQAGFALGRMYEQGLGVAQDYVEAAKWYKTVSESPYPKAWQWVAAGLTEGWYLIILSWIHPYEVITDHDIRASSYNALGRLYEEGLGVRQDYGKALSHYRKAEKWGNADAESNIASMYEKGLGVGRDHQEAMKRYRKAADHGSPNAQIKLGSLYEEGLVLRQDYSEAASWYRKAATGGNAEGEYMLGALLSKRLNNPVEGIEWLRKSASQGDLRARDELAELHVPDSPSHDEEIWEVPKATLATYVGQFSADPPFQVLINGNPEPKLVVQKNPGTDGFDLLGPPQNSGSELQPGANKVRILARSAADEFLLFKEEKLSFLKRPPFSRSYAVVIAISKYQTAGYPEAEGTVPLAKQVVARLERQGFEVKTFFDEQATADAIDLYMRNELAPKLTKNDRVIFYFCGHGDTEKGPNGKDVGYLVTYGVSRSAVALRGLPMRRLRGEYVDLLVAKHVLFLLDACFSGLAFLETTPTEEDMRRQKLAKYREVELLASGGMRAILTAGRKEDRAINANGGLFTRKFLEAIEGAADYDGNGVVTLEELYCYIATNVRKAALNEGYEQEPQIDKPSEYGSGSFIFLYR